MAWLDDEEAIQLRDARHRITNVFQLLGALGRLRAQRAIGEEARRQVGWLQEAINALGVLQRRQLSPGGEDFGAFLADMTPHWRRRAAARRIEVAVETEAVEVSEQAAAALALIAQELVLNAVSHAFPDGRAGGVRVEFRRVGDGRAALSVADDGVGCHDATQSADHLGLWLVQGLTEQLGGALTMESAGGFAARIEFPLT
jgi:two-component sensor histidine kinase